MEDGAGRDFRRAESEAPIEHPTYPRRNVPGGLVEAAAIVSGSDVRAAPFMPMFRLCAAAAIISAKARAARARRRG